jgi:hypothetical protein
MSISKSNIMDTLTLRVDKHHRSYKDFISYLYSLPFVKLDNKEEELQPSAKTRRAIADVDEGKTNKYVSSKELFDKLGI